jgi:cytochrome c oxidase subunit I+III
VNAPERPETFTYPNAVPRPPGELEELKRIWASPKGFAIVTDVNNTNVGLWYVGTALLFFILAGILALIMRTQLACRRATSSDTISITSSSRCTAP